MKYGNKNWKCCVMAVVVFGVAMNVCFAAEGADAWKIDLRDRVWDVRLDVGMNDDTRVGKIGNINVFALVEDKGNANKTVDAGFFKGMGRLGFGFNRVNRGVGVVDGEFVIKFWRWKAGVFVGANMAFLTEDVGFAGDWRKAVWMDTRFMATKVDNGRFRFINDKAAVFGGGFRLGINF